VWRNLPRAKNHVPARASAAPTSIAQSTYWNILTTLNIRRQHGRKPVAILTLISSLFC
jgi:hypothetical protein